MGSTRAFPSPRFWTAETGGLLFLFHLHGFSELAAYAAGPRTAEGDAFWTAVLEDWLAECGRPARPSWHPFPTSGRIIAWCAALSAESWPPPLARRMRDSLAVQATVLGRSIEYEIGGNHVLRNAVALTFAGVCLRQRGLERRGLRLLERELGDQVLADGGHEERSPSYHREVLGDLQDVRELLRRAGRGAQPWLDEHIDRMTRWLAALAGPDGRVPLLNDAWEAPPTARSEEPFADLADSGYLVVRGQDSQAVLDVGPVSPPHLPPHAHADVLSFVLWVDGKPVIVDPGVLSYSGPARDEFRATRAHNTVEVDGVDQCVFWGDFRAAKMPRVRRLRLDRRDGVVVVSAEHDGYRRLPDPVTHRRTFVWFLSGGLVVVDRLLCEVPHATASFLHLAPGVEWDGAQAGPLVIRPLGAGGSAASERGRYAPFIGTAVPTTTIARRGRTAPGELSGWALLRPGFSALLADGRLSVEGPGLPPTEVRVD